MCIFSRLSLLVMILSLTASHSQRSLSLASTGSNQKLAIFNNKYSRCCSCLDCCPCPGAGPFPLPGPVDPGIPTGPFGNIENIDYSLETQTVTPVNEGVIPSILGGNLLNRVGSARRSVMIRRRIVRPNGMVYLEVDDPGGVFSGTRTAFGTRYWPYALENGNSSRSKLIESDAENKYTFDDEKSRSYGRDERRSSSRSDSQRRMIFIKAG